MERPRLFTMLANSTPRSPAGPITAASHRGYNSRRRSSEAGTSLPQRPAAGRSSAPPAPSRGSARPGAADETAADASSPMVTYPGSPSAPVTMR